LSQNGIGRLRISSQNPILRQSLRAVLTGEADGLSTRAIVAGVLLLRPSTSDASVHGALHQMRKRGELSRAGFHKNYKYVLVTSSDAPSASSAGDGGEAH
jgi:hypothetical protein